MMLNYATTAWPLQLVKCPCDAHFFYYCRDLGVRGQAIFHFGTGQHHYLGTRNMELGTPNEIFGVTASRDEYQSYIDLIIQHPEIANVYKVMFCDIYTLTPRSVPRFDLVSLFHLCEFHSDKNRAYTRGDDWTLLELFLERLNPGGQLLFYRRSSGYPKAKSLIKRLESAGKIVMLTDFESITAYRKIEAS